MMTVQTEYIQSTYTVHTEYVLLKNQSLGCCKSDQWNLGKKKKKCLNTIKGRENLKSFDPKWWCVMVIPWFELNNETRDIYIKVFGFWGIERQNQILRCHRSKFKL